MGCADMKTEETKFTLEELEFIRYLVKKEKEGLKVKSQEKWIKLATRIEDKIFTRHYGNTTLRDYGENTTLKDYEIGTK